MANTVPPHADQDFNTFVTAFVPYVAAHATNLGISTGMVTQLNDNLLLWTDGFGDHQAKQTAARAATEVKDQAKTALTGVARAAIGIIQNNPAVSNEQREEMGLPVHDKTPSRVPVPTTKPLLQIEGREHLQHVVHFKDEAKPTSKAKPAGVRGAQIWLWIGPNPPADPGGFRWVALDSATPYLMVHAGADGGKTAYYAARWENTRGETGPWSDVISATIPG